MYITMVVKKFSKSKLAKAFFGCFFSILVLFSAFFTAPVYAEPAVNQPTTTETTNNNATANNTGVTTGSTSCESSLGAIGWLVCPTTGKISEAVDWLYEKIEDILLINPVEAKDGQPIYEIWKYFRAVTNIVFIIFLLVVIYSQITGWGINNYGLKKILPKLIVTAILVNLSFLICSVAVDLSNIVGNSLRGLFESIEAATMPGMAFNNGQSHIALAEMYQSMAGGTALAIGGGVIAFETGAIWMLIPVILGAIVAVVTGLITIALRQAVVVLLIMIAPLAMVAYMLPNTDRWFKQWKQLLYKMLIFYPMFSLLFGASSLAGWAIIANAQDGFSLLLGVAVQIFPLFFSWKLMKMSGTFLGAINASMHRLAAAPLETNRAWASSHRDLTRAKNLARGDAYTPSLKLRQYLENRKIARGEETTRHLTTVKNRGLAYDAKRNYKGGDLDGVLNKRGERAYEDQARGMGYQQEALRHTNNMNEGFGNRAKYGSERKARLDRLDVANVKFSDVLKAEQARTEAVEQKNAEGYYNRITEAKQAHQDYLNSQTLDENGQPIKFKEHFVDQAKYQEALDRYGMMESVMKGDVRDINFLAGTAAHSYDTQNKLYHGKIQKYFELLPPTADVVFQLRELAKYTNASESMDAIIAGGRVLNQRGDAILLRGILTEAMNLTYKTDDKNGHKAGDRINVDDFVKAVEENNVDGGVDLGTHASQSLASFLQFEVKDEDPFLRRFGKYINLETAQVFNPGGKRDKKYSKVTYDEFLKGYYGIDGAGEKIRPKRDIVNLMEGTAFDKIGREAFDNLDEALLEAYGDDHEGRMKRREQIQRAAMPQILSATFGFLSGSEQIKSTTKFITGYKQDKNGNWVGAWEEKDDNGNYKIQDPQKRKMIEESYRRMALEGNLFARTVGQYFKTKTDEQIPFEKHLESAWKAEHPGWEDDERTKDFTKDDMISEQTVTGFIRAGKYDQMLSIVDRSPGATTDVKPFPRRWARLDDTTEARKKAKEIRTRLERERHEVLPPEDTDDIDMSQFSDEDRGMFMLGLDNVWNHRQEREGSFYDQSMAWLLGEFKSEENIVVRKYRDYYEKSLRKGISLSEADLYSYLKGALSDPELYD